MHPAVRAALLICGSMAVEGAAITWAANHLKHHAYADEPGDPHSPVEGLFHAHLGGLFCGVAFHTRVQRMRPITATGIIA